MSMEQFAAFARINPERSFITSDMGQQGIINPLEAMRKTIQALLAAGLPQNDIDRMVRHNPAYLVGLEK